MLHSRTTRRALSDLQLFTSRFGHFLIISQRIKSIDLLIHFKLNVFISFVVESLKLAVAGTANFHLVEASHQRGTSFPHSSVAPSAMRVSESAINQSASIELVMNGNPIPVTPIVHGRSSGGQRVILASKSITNPIISAL
jgi:hypothetical protein